jgi:hypothetical protein
MNSERFKGIQSLTKHLKRSIFDILASEQDIHELESYFKHIELKLELLRLEARLEEDDKCGGKVRLLLNEELS